MISMKGISFELDHVVLIY